MQDGPFTTIDRENSKLIDHKKDTEYKEKFCGGCIVVTLFLVLFLIPTLSVVFSQVFPWQEDGSVCDPTKFGSVTNSSGTFDNQPVKCTCRENFPTYLFVEGVLEIITLCLLLVFFSTYVRHYFFADIEDVKVDIQAINEENKTIGVLACVGCCAVLTYVVCLVITIMMLESVFSSNRKCGEWLWTYGAFLCACFSSASIPLLIYYGGLGGGGE